MSFIGSVDPALETRIVIRNLFDDPDGFNESTSYCRCIGILSRVLNQFINRLNITRKRNGATKR